MVDLAAAYQRMDEVLRQYGRGEVSYSITVTVFNHRREDGSAKVRYTVQALIPEAGEYGCVTAYNTGSLDEAFGAMHEALRPYARPTAEGLDDIREVRLPGEAA